MRWPSIFIYIGTICSPFKQNNNVRYNTFVHTKLLLPMAWVFRIENIFPLIHYTLSHLSQLTYWKLTALVSFSLCVCVIPPSVPKEEKKSHYKINFYSPCDKCYAYVGVQCSFCYGKMVSPFWWTHCDDSYTVSQIHFKQKTWILLNLQIEIFIRVPAGFHLNFVNCSNKHVYQTIWPWLGKLMLYVNFSNIKIANFTRWWSICGSIFHMLFFFLQSLS